MRLYKDLYANVQRSIHHNSQNNTQMSETNQIQQRQCGLSGNETMNPYKINKMLVVSFYFITCYRGPRVALCKLKARHKRPILHDSIYLKCQKSNSQRQRNGLSGNETGITVNWFGGIFLDWCKCSKSGPKGVTMAQLDRLLKITELYT